MDGKVRGGDTILFGEVLHNAKGTKAVSGGWMSFSSKGFAS